LWDAKTSDPFAKGNLPLVSPEMQAIIVGGGTCGAHRSGHRVPCRSPLMPIRLRTTPRREGRAMTGAKILRLVVAAMLKTPPKGTPIHEQIVDAWALDNPHAKDLIRRALVLLADHELNASTFTVRCAASTGISLYDAVIAGLVALKGPRHGGVGPQASRLLDHASRRRCRGHHPRPRGAGRTLSGLRPHGLSRRRSARRVAVRALKKTNIDKRLRRRIPERIREATGAFANCDYALAVMRRALAMPQGCETTMFAMARTAGWIAHASEQLESKTLIRPRARYVGPAPTSR
jgi:citrate synthase